MNYAGAGKKGGLSENRYIGNGYIGIPIHLMTSFSICPFPIYPELKMDISVWIDRKSEYIGFPIYP
jgi:hypothetical protein